MFIPAHPIFFFQDGTTEIDDIHALAVADDGSIFLAGYTLGNWTGTNLGARDFAACKLDGNGTLLWKWQVTYYS